MLIEKSQCQQDEIVEIHGIAGVQGRFVPGTDVLGQRANAFIRQRPPYCAATVL